MFIGVKQLHALAGVDDVDSYQQLCDFVRIVSEGSPVLHFIVHCRKAILNLDTTKNRSVPPLRRGWAFALRRDFPHLHFSVNGQARSWPQPSEALAMHIDAGWMAEPGRGKIHVAKPNLGQLSVDFATLSTTSINIQPAPAGVARLNTLTRTKHQQTRCCVQVDTTEQALQVLAAEPVPGARPAGVMIGRAAWKRPWDCFSDADRAVFGADVNAAVNRRQVSAHGGAPKPKCPLGTLRRWCCCSDALPLSAMAAAVRLSYFPVTCCAGAAAVCGVCGCTAGAVAHETRRQPGAWRPRSDLAAAAAVLRREGASITYQSMQTLAWQLCVCRLSCNFTSLHLHRLVTV